MKRYCQAGRNKENVYAVHRPLVRPPCAIEKTKNTEMKPIILVIMSGAMLLLAIHQDTDNKDHELSRSSTNQRLHVNAPEKKQDTETLTHNVSLWMDRVQ